MSETSGKAVGAPRLGNVPEVKAVCVQKAVADVVDSVVYRCGGRVLWGPSNDSVLQLSGWFLVLGFSSVYFGFCAERIWEDLSPGWVVLIAVLDAVLIYCYFVACFREPGIIPSRQVRELGEAQRPGFKAEMAEVLEKEAQSDSVYHKSFHLAKYAEAAWCGTCMVARPSLSTHCRQCDHCVSVWDHHCNWVGNCIGARNHRQFIGFLLSVLCMCMCMCMCMCVCEYVGTLSFYL
jgi:palmitoyltransferase ZDHHC9/14/18